MGVEIIDDGQGEGARDSEQEKGLHGRMFRTPKAHPTMGALLRFRCSDATTGVTFHEWHDSLIDQYSWVRPDAISLHQRKSGNRYRLLGRNPMGMGP